MEDKLNPCAFRRIWRDRMNNETKRKETQYSCTIENWAFQSPAVARKKCKACGGNPVFGEEVV